MRVGRDRGANGLDTVYTDSAGRAARLSDVHQGSGSASPVHPRGLRFPSARRVGIRLFALCGILLACLAASASTAVASCVPGWHQQSPDSPPVFLDTPPTNNGWNGYNCQLTFTMTPLPDPIRGFAARNFSNVSRFSVALPQWGVWHLFRL